MPSKLKKAIGAVKDQTSISLAKVAKDTSTSANLEITILKATSHDVVPINDKYVHQILSLISTSKSNAAACAQAIGRRIGKTRNWIVALKSLMLVLHIFQDGDPYFPIEVLHAMKRGTRILNLSNFRDNSSCPWDYTAFVRSFALYLEERLDCFLTGKLQRRFTYQRGQDCIIINNNSRRRSDDNEPVVRDMKPPMLLDRIQFWQKLLDRAMATIPTGAAQTNRLILISLYTVVQETYDLYRDISDGLALLLDSFFHLQYQSCLSAFHACVKSSKQFEELSNFYGSCKALGVGRTSEYPSIHKISDELLETLQDFLKDQASFPGRSPPYRLERKASSPEHFELANSDPCDVSTASERGSAFGSARTSLSDLLCYSGGAEAGAEEQLSERSLSPFQSPLREFPIDNKASSSSQSPPPQVDLLDIFPPQQIDHHVQTEANNQSEDEKPGWDLVLFESPNQTSPSPSGPNVSPNLLESSTSRDLDYFFRNSSTSDALGHNNPFLQDIVQVEGFAIPTSNSKTSNLVGLENFDDLFSFPSTSQPWAAPPPLSVPSPNGNLDEPAWVAETPKLRTMLPSFAAYIIDSAVVPTFPAHTWEGSSTSTSFCEQNSITGPTFQAEFPSDGTLALPYSAESPQDMTLALSICEENSKESAMSQTTMELTPDTGSIVPVFHSAEPNELAAAMPTFSARSSDNETARVVGSPFALENDDPFGTFSGVTSTSEPMINGTMSQEAVLNQQRLWLEQQNKIISKHLT